MEIIIVAIGLAALVGYYLFVTMRSQKLNKAKIAEEKGDLDTALAIFMESHKKDPDNLETIWHLGNINEEKGLIPEAIGYYNKLISIGRESKLFTIFELYRRIGLLYRQIGRDRDALEFLFEAYSLIPTAKDVLENITMIVYSQKQFYRAQVLFEKCAQIIDNNAFLKMHQGLCLIMLDKTDQALNVLDEARRLNPKSPETKFLLAFTHIKMNSYATAAELIEDVINTSGPGLSMDMMYMAVKILYLVYLNFKNFEVVKDLVQRLKDMAVKAKNRAMEDEVNNAFIFFRVRQGYYENAILEISRAQNASVEVFTPEGQKTPEITMDEEALSKNQLYQMVVSLNKLKKEKEKLQVSSGNMRSARYDYEYSILDKNLIDTQEKVDRYFEEWKQNFIVKDPLWAAYGPEAKSQFDPVPIIEKFTGDALKAIKNRISSYKDDEDQKLQMQISSKNPCDTFLSCDFPTFLQITRKLAEAMGYRIINQGVKLDKVAFASGKGVDFLCTEKFNTNIRILFCTRRWGEPIGNLAVTDLIAAMKPMNVGRIILISSTGLSTEARMAIEGRKLIDFYLCDDVVQHLY